MNTLFLEERVKDRRYCVDGIKAEDGRTYFISFNKADVKWKYRTTNKRTGKPLQKVIKEVECTNILYLDTQYESKDGYTYRGRELESQVWEQNLPYTAESILKVVNSISTVKYGKVEVR